MKKLLYFALVALLSGCVKVVPLKGDYPGKPFYGYSDRPAEEVWARLMDVVTDYGLEVKFIEKNSGVVISEEVSILSKGSAIRGITHEDRKGKLINPRAMVVSERLDTSNPKNVVHDRAFAKWSVIIRQAGNKTAIKTVLSNLDIYDVNHRYGFTTFRYNAHSLGNFENWLFGQIK